ncbi:MAG TPA: LuxR C-terminal-related transcriptional regulator, partial [Candidatus Dormibacteraeota bacterium]|nr:LuxR C-terminal-related transcriptional regulator [Candidatus Dormibacteraeota bacterium]
LLQGTLDALANLEQPEPESSTKRLSQTEYQVLAQVGQARTIAEIAVARGISQKTVRNHLASIYRKMEIRSRTEAILLAARMGLSPE